ncbi:hypothetical protein [Amycolatopsis pithecellobii]|uniref:hypothetical protein n=1 Tax=Amycolatopsis pithecellobii TaxID=664692 RepID=UPI001FE8E126|nr:hypothetical protein [Amycolatopsis pithecellobii]
MDVVIKFGCGVEELTYLTLEQNLSAPQNENVVGENPRDRQVMGDEDTGEMVLLLQCHQQIENLPLDGPNCHQPLPRLRPALP